MLAYESSGQGIPLVLIHAFPLNSNMWKAQIKNLEQYGRVIALDLPGFGRSPSEANLSIAKMAQEVARLLSALNVKEPAVIAGLSLGGYVALEFFRQFPERVKGLGLFSTRSGADTAEAREKRLKTAKQIMQEGLEPFAKIILPNLVGKTALATKPKLVNEITGMISLNNREGVAAALFAMAERRDSSDLLGSIKCPTLIIAGEEDVLIPFSESRVMHGQIVGSQFHVIPRAGHLVNFEQPTAFQNIFGKFLNQKLQNPFSLAY